MPQYIPLKSLSPSLRPFLRTLSPSPTPNPLFRKPTPSQTLLSLQSTNQLPPNVRVQDWTENRERWNGVGMVARFGGRKTKDYGKEWREGVGREGRKKGGLVWALRER